jgi:hypothetical protein
VRVAVAVLGVLGRRLLGMLVGVLILGGKKVDGLGDLQHLLRAVLLHRLVDGRLEAGLVDDEVGLAQLGGLPHGELEVMGLPAR